MNSIKKIKSVSLMRRLLAIFYDSLLLLAILFLATALATAMNGGDAIEPTHKYYLWFVLYLMIIAYIFFAWFWVHGGQTLGMKTWKIKLQTIQGGHVNWSLALVRYITAIVSWVFVGAGFLWSLGNKKNKTWHDLITRSELVDLRNK